VHDQRGAAVHRARYDADFLSARAHISIDRRVGPDISDIDRFCENRFHRARARIVNVPLNFDVRSKALLEPTFSLA